MLNQIQNLWVIHKSHACYVWFYRYICIIFFSYFHYRLIYLYYILMSIITVIMNDHVPESILSTYKSKHSTNLLIHWIKLRLGIVQALTNFYSIICAKAKLFLKWKCPWRWLQKVISYVIALGHLPKIT